MNMRRSLSNKDLPQAEPLVFSSPWRWLLIVVAAIAFMVLQAATSYAQPGPAPRPSHKPCPTRGNTGQQQSGPEIVRSGGSCKGRSFLA